MRYPKKPPSYLRAKSHFSQRSLDLKDINNWTAKNSGKESANMEDYFSYVSELLNKGKDSFYNEKYENYRKSQKDLSHSSQSINLSGMLQNTGSLMIDEKLQSLENELKSKNN
jgi:hypothetical protein